MILPVFFLPFLLGYALGSIPFGLIWARLFLKKDIRTLGSGNIGATNVLRTGNKQIAALTLFCDVFKGALAVSLCFFLFNGPLEMGAWGLGGAVVGHIFPIWLKFKGGKGVATLAGGVLVLLPLTGFLSFLTWILVFLVTRISSLSALLAILCAPFYAYFSFPCPLSQTSPSCLRSFSILIFLCGLVIFKHSENIKRLLKGTERSFKK